MLFNSYVFVFLFLPLTLLGFHVLGRKSPGGSWGKAWLVAASLFYYAWWKPPYLLLLIGSMLFNFWMGVALGRAQAPSLRKHTLLALGVSANLGLIGYYKYCGFFAGLLPSSLGGEMQFPQLLLPLGISFFTFQQIAYLVDASRGLVKEKSLLDYSLFVTFFPQLIAGPIVHHAEMMPQFREKAGQRWSWENMSVGISLFTIGLSKKILIADNLSHYVSRVFGAAGEGSVLYATDVWAGVICYTFQLYFDFSGYSDMALGLGRMFGIVLPLNFNSPYKAVDLVDFWRRWHITLSRWLRDYIYIPLGGNRRGPARRYVNLFVTMLLGGLWHGAGWTFVVWGGLHGIGLAITHLAKRLWWGGRGAGAPLPSWTLWPRRILTLAFVMLGWVFFRADSIETAGHMLESMFGLTESPVAGTKHLLKAKLWVWLGALLAMVWFTPNAAEITQRYRPALLTYAKELRTVALWRQLKLNPAWAAFIGLLLAASILNFTRAGEFLYYNF
jgi:D-alanyl-lipoteichoic acid acyltransferase DltB (MBOAT superfamily)